MRKYILGLDIGVASVGWGIVDKDTYEVIDTAVTLFDSADASKNIERRDFRQARRGTRRKKRRLNDADKLFNKVGLIRPESLNNSPLKLRVKGLNQRLTKEELYAALYNIVKHRGISYLDEITDEKISNKALELNGEELKIKFPCQIQYERLNKYNQFRGTIIDGENQFINTFTTKSYCDEAEAILNKQKEFHSFINYGFIEELIKLIKRKREYYIGPGSEKSKTNYGIYKTDGTTLKNLFDDLRGKCSIFNGKYGMDSEYRASGFSYTAQYFNVLNDLNNIKVNGEKLSKNIREKIMEDMKNSKKKLTEKQINKIISLDKTKDEPITLTGFRKDKNDKNDYHSFEGYRKFKIFLEENDININKYSIDQLNAIADILTLNTERDGINKFFKETKEDCIKNMSDKEIELFVKFRQKNSSLFSKWHSFSYRLMKLIIPEMLRTGDEQHTTINKMKIIKYENKKTDKIDIDDITDEIYNPIVTRSIRQALLIVNKLIKKYKFEDIVVELAREEHSGDEKKAIEKYQKENAKLIDKICDEYGIDLVELEVRNKGRLKEKLKYLYEQDGKSIYTGKIIEPRELISNPERYEIDHIIPLSISFNDSQNNKVLVENTQNSKKNNMTPFQYLSGNHGDISYEQYKAMVLSNSKLSKKKKANLLFEEDITKEEVLQGFINRNINDTRYASKVVYNALNHFFKDFNTKVKVINGSYTNFMRKKVVKLDKDRDLNYAHHGIDALICCYSLMKLDKYKEALDDIVNLETGEILDKTKYQELDEEQRKDLMNNVSLEKIKLQLIDAEKNMRFAHKVSKKVNRSVSKQTIYGTRTIGEDTYYLGQIDNIYNDKDYAVFKKKYDKEKKQFLIYRNDKKTWEKIEKIIAMYPDEKNPFAKYKEEFGFITKYAKKDNGPNIITLKYLDKRLGSHIDISHKYNSKNKVVLLSLNSFRSDIYYNKAKNNFNIIPVIVNDFKYNKGQYTLNLQSYFATIKRELKLENINSFEDIEKAGHEFRFSLYKNDKFVLGKSTDDKIETKLFVAKNKKEKNHFQYKNIDNKTNEMSMTAKQTDNLFYKINTDVLGYDHKIFKEKFKIKFNLDSKNK